MSTYRASRSHSGDVLHPVVRRIVITVAVVSAAATVGGMLWGTRLMAPEASMRDSYGGGPLGHRAFAETFEALGVVVMQSRGARFDGPSAPLFFIEPSKETRVDGRNYKLEDAITKRVEQGLPTLVVLPKWNLSLGAVSPTAVPDPALDIQEVLDAAFPLDDFYEKNNRIYLGDDLGGHHLLGGLLGEFHAELPRIQAISSPPSTSTVLLDSEVGAMVIQEGSLIVVSDPDLLHNFNIHRADHARLWLAISQRLGADTIVIDETFHGHGHMFNLREVAGQFPAFLIVVQALLICVLIVVLGSKRFGAPERGTEGEHGPREAIAVAASVLADGQPLPHLAYHYLTALLFDLHMQLGLPDAPTLQDRAVQLDKYAEQREIAPQAQKLLSQASALTERNQAWTLVRAAYTFRFRLLGRSGAQHLAQAAAPSESTSDDMKKAS